MINNLSGQGVQDYVINQQASQATQTTALKDEAQEVKPVEQATESPSVIVTLGSKQDVPVTYSTSGGIGKPPPT